MQNFLGNPCPYCNKNFAAGDDIVVCPECGTPHHRECYKEHSACANEEKHSENYEWKSSLSAVHVHKKPDAESAENISCPHCGTENPSSCHYCQSCGAPFEKRENLIRNSSKEEFQRERERIITASFEGDLNGISPKEAAIFVRSNIGYFLPRFAAFTKGAKFDTNFSAFFFSYFYLFYRKMYGLGIAVFVATMILSIPTFLLDLVTIQQQYVDMGLLSQIIWEIPHQQELAIFSLIGSAFIWAIRIALMMFFNRLYFARVINKVKIARTNLAHEKEDAIANFFRKKGGTSIILPIILLCLVLLSSFVLAGFIVTSEFFIMPDMTNFL
ncbi:MAG: DUF2628 domain-containing protein [Oscillospiraceae bacterium]|nr:DUF2628 domain-containing protein [Oscillospiraceae bacterium]